jgi:hypothetical protein
VLVELGEIVRADRAVERAMRVAGVAEQDDMSNTPISGMTLPKAALVMKPMSRWPSWTSRIISTSPPAVPFGYISTR